MLKNWATAAQIYFDKRMLTMILLGFSSGFPLLLVFGTFNLWLKDAGVSLEVIGLFSLVKTPYSLKWAWSPIIDRVKLPLFCRLGRRRGWALFTQLILMAAIWAMAVTDPIQQTMSMVIFAFIMVIASASQDIVLDAYRIESFTPKEQGAGVGVFVLGYRLGTIFSGAGALYMASVMSWEDVYKIMAAAAIIGMLTIIFSREPKKEAQYVEPKCRGTWRQRLECFMGRAVYEPFADFMKRRDWLYILLFIFLYRMSDAYIGPMAYPFYDDLGFTKGEIATISKVFGVIATICGTLIGGIVVSRYGVMKALLYCGIFQGASNLVFAVQAYLGHNIYGLMVNITIENVASGMGVAAYVAYMSSLCNVAYTATQYALLSSLMSFARDVFAATSGYLAAIVSWPMFFVITTFMSIPGLLVLLYLQKRIKLEKIPLS